MHDVFHNYAFYLEKAARGRKWVKQYLHERLSDKYLNLVKPLSIVLGKENIIGDNILITNSKALYKKYCTLAVR